MSKSPKSKVKKSRSKGAVKKTAPKRSASTTRSNKPKNKKDGPFIKKTEKQKDSISDFVSSQIQNKINETNLKKPILSICAILLIVGGYFSWPYWSFAIKPYFTKDQWSTIFQKPEAKPASKKIVEISSERLAKERRQLQVSINVLMDRMNTIEKAVTEVKRLAQTTTPLPENSIDNATLDTLDNRLKILEKNDANLSDLLKRIKEIKEDEIRRKENQAKPKIIESENLAKNYVVDKNNPLSGKASLVLATENLRKTIDAGLPFNDQLEELTKISGNNLGGKAAFIILTKYAKTGVFSLPNLKKRYFKLAGKIVQSSRLVDNSSWQSRIINKLSSIVSWRRIDGKGNNTSIDTIVASAETELKANNIKKTVSLLEGLSINSKAEITAKEWLTDAKNHLDAQKAINSLYIHSISQLSLPKTSKD